MVQFLDQNCSFFGSKWRSATKKRTLDKFDYLICIWPPNVCNVLTISRFEAISLIFTFFKSNEFQQNIAYTKNLEMANDFFEISFRSRFTFWYFRKKVSCNIFWRWNTHFMYQYVLVFFTVRFPYCKSLTHYRFIGQLSYL